MNVCGWGLTVEIGVGEEKPGDSEGKEGRYDGWGIRGRCLN